MMLMILMLALTMIDSATGEHESRPRLAHLNFAQLALCRDLALEPSHLLGDAPQLRRSASEFEWRVQLALAAYKLPVKCLLSHRKSDICELSACCTGIEPLDVAALTLAMSIHSASTFLRGLLLFCTACTILRWHDLRARRRPRQPRRLGHTQCGRTVAVRRAGAGSPSRRHAT